MGRWSLWRHKMGDMRVKVDVIFVWVSSGATSYMIRDMFTVCHVPWACLLTLSAKTPTSVDAASQIGSNEYPYLRVRHTWRVRCKGFPHTLRMNRVYPSNTC